MQGADQMVVVAAEVLEPRAAHAQRLVGACLGLGDAAASSCDVLVARCAASGTW